MIRITKMAKGLGTFATKKITKLESSEISVF